MGIFDKVKKGVKDRDKAHKDQVEQPEKHEEGTPRQNKRQCVDIDPVTKAPTFYDCED
jgi:hypothetical protein